MSVSSISGSSNMAAIQAARAQAAQAARQSKPDPKPVQSASAEEKNDAPAAADHEDQESSGGFKTTG